MDHKGEHRAVKNAPPLTEEEEDLFIVSLSLRLNSFEHYKTRFDDKLHSPCFKMGVIDGLTREFEKDNHEPRLTTFLCREGRKIHLFRHEHYGRP